MTLRKLFAMITLAGATVSSQYVCAGDVFHSRIKAGWEVDTGMSDVDTSSGPYLAYVFDLPEPMSVLIDLNYITGDFDVASGSGSYTSVGLGAALLFSRQIENWKPYVGAGAVNFINDFDNVEYDNKLSMVWIAGTSFVIGERFGLDASVRYRTLRVNADDMTVKPNPLNMDAVILRLGLVYEL